jgi:hypothetical protein
MLPRITQLFHEFQADWFEKIRVIRGNIVSLAATEKIVSYFH